MILSKARLALAGWNFHPGVRERCWKRLGRQLETAHLPLEYCFHLLEERALADKSPLSLVYATIGARLARGYSVGAAIASFATPEEVMLIDAGQSAGETGLAKGFLRAASLMEKKRQMRAAIAKELVYPAKKRQMRAAIAKELVYPASLVAAMAAFLVVIAHVLVPKLAVLANPATWQGAGAVLYETSLFVSSWKGAATLLGLCLAGLAIVLSLPHLTGRVRVYADYLPPWSVYRLVTGVSWLYATALLLQTRQKLGTILQGIMEARATSPYLRWRLNPIHQRVCLGQSLGEALCRGKDRWPDRTMAEDMRVYSSLPGFADMVTEVAEGLMEDAMERVQRLAKTMGGLAILGVIALLILLVMGLFGIQEQITGAVGRMGHI